MSPAGNSGAETAARRLRARHAEHVAELGQGHVLVGALGAFGAVPAGDEVGHGVGNRACMLHNQSHKRERAAMKL